MHFQPQGKHGGGNRKFLFYPFLCHLIRLLYKIPLQMQLRRRTKHFICDTDNTFRRKAAGHCQYHIVQIIKSMIGLIQAIRRNFRDTFHRSGDINGNGVFHIHCLEQIE